MADILYLRNGEIAASANSSYSLRRERVVGILGGHKKKGTNMSKPLTTQKTVIDIVKEFEQGIIAIPEIQRDVVWNASQIKSLLDSISRGYPCGSIILWEPRERDKTLVKAMIRPERLSNF